MNSKKFLKLVAICGVALLTASCSPSRSNGRASRLPATPSTTPQPATQISSSPTPTPNSPMRSVDLDNIAYSNFPDYSGSKKRHITLNPGEGGPNFINYGDITGDGEEEAMAALGIPIRGSAIPYYVYIFTTEYGHAKLIWDFETGDRADGGLRQVYADNGELVIELFGKDRVIGEELYRGDEGLCCPTSFTRTRYKWTGKRFQPLSKEVLPNPAGNAAPVMPLYSPNEPTKP